MAGFAETHRCAVNTWECDENAHLNVQFYVKRFDEAARFFSAMSGGRHDGSLPKTRHVRFHGELHTGAVMRMRSAQVVGGRFGGFVVHLLDNLQTGALSATALDSPDRSTHGQWQVDESEIERAMPRGIDARATVPIPARDISLRGGLVTNRAIIVPAECDVSGNLLQQFYIARLSDGAPHAWEKAGITTSCLQERNYGRVAMEMKITHHEPARAGDGMVLHSIATVSGRKTLTLHHELVRLGDDAPLATAEVIAVVMDLASRRTVEMAPLTAEGAA